MESGVSIHKPEKCLAGYTLCCEEFEDTRGAKDGVGRIYLVDMEGRVAHTWFTRTAQQSHCRLLPDGNLLYPTRDRSKIAEAGLRELDPESNVVWSYHCRIDHDYQVLADGNIMVHCIRDFPWPALGPELKRHPYIIEITRGKDLVWEWHGEEHVDELKALLPAQAWRHFLERTRGRYAFDWAHNNTCQIIPPNATYDKEVAAGAKPRFKPGNIVFSYRSVDVIGVIDRESGGIVWAWGPGVLDGQHKPHVLANGNILIFDNGTVRGWSRVIEVNPLSGEIEWEYGAKPEERFSSGYISGAQRLPNGNTLVCQGDGRRLFEVTRERELVWEFVLPHDEGSLGETYRCLRYTAEYVQPLFDRRQWPGSLP